MQSAIDHLHANLNYAKSLGTLYSALEARTTIALDLSDILRAELVMSVSALDHYIHEIVEIGMQEIYAKKRPPTSRFLEFSVPLRDFWEDPSVLINHAWLIDQVRIKHSFRSFQRSQNITDAIRLVSEISLWDEVSRIVGMPAQDLKDQLDLIVDRRNKIAHEADMDPTNPEGRWPINASQVNDAISFMERIGDAIYQILI